MPLATAATGIGKQVVTHAVGTWLGAKRERAERDAELIDLVRLSVRDHFQQRKLVRQLEDLADQIAERLRLVKQLPAFEPRALTELLGRFSPVTEGIAEVLHRLPRTTLDAPSGSEHDEEFRARYLTHVSETLDELEQFGI